MGSGVYQIKLPRKTTVQIPCARISNIHFILEINPSCEEKTQDAEALSEFRFSGELDQAQLIYLHLQCLKRTPPQYVLPAVMLVYYLGNVI